MTTYLSETSPSGHRYVDASTYNYDTIYDLIRWAAEDEDWLSSMTEEDRNWWGRWDQGLWGAIRTTVSSLIRTSPELPRGSVPSNALVSGIPIVNDTFHKVLAESIRGGVCGTAYCQAGQAVHQNGYRLITDRGSSADNCIKQQPTDLLDKWGKVVWVDVPDASPQAVSGTAQEVLGLTDDEAGDYFRGSNPVDGLKALANGQCEARGIPLMWPDHEVANVEWGFDYDSWLENRDDADPDDD